MAEEQLKQENLGTALSLEGRVGVYPERPLPILNAAGGAAFAARLNNDMSQELFAIVCSRGLFPRVDQVTALKNVDSASMLKLKDYGVMDWPAEGGRFYALVFEKPLAERFWKTLDEKHPMMSEDAVNNSFVIPMIKALLEFQRTGLVHGGIRPTNIFWRMGSTTPPQIGETLSAPSGFGQPTLFETIERSMCTPVGRGSGFHTDDTYAFGVTLAFVFLGHNPVADMDDHAILQAKIQKGSFSTLIGKHRLPPSHIELLRGLLSDDPNQRWTAEDLEQWMTGRRMTPKNSDAGRRASRHFDIAGKEYWQLKPLAMALTENVADAVKLIENGSLEKWLVRSLGDEDRYKNVGEAIARLREAGKSSNYQEQLVTRVCIALDPSGPIRYRGVAVMPLGIASFLANAVLTGNNIQIISEIIVDQFVALWVNMQREGKTDLVPYAQQIERMRGYLERGTLGSGIERVLYELNPFMPCLSPLLKREYVPAPRHLLPALERVALHGGAHSDPMDRHIAAFLLARERRSESLFVAMGPQEVPVRRGLALLSLFGEMQYRYGPDSLPRLCSWILPLVEPCLNRFLSKPFQEKVRRQVKTAVETGSLSTLLRQIDDPDRVLHDEEGFLQARAMYRDVMNETRTLEESLGNKAMIARQMGRPVAASVASVIGLILIAITLGKALIRSMFGV